MQFTHDDIINLSSRYRAHLINGITGYKCIHLLGTTDGQDNHNLAIISSVVHLGADPAMIGFVMRPDTVVRDSLNNINTQKAYTLNSINEDHWKQAHHTSAKFLSDESEFEQCGFTAQLHKDFNAPFVHSSNIKMGLMLHDIIELPNQTLFVIGNLTQLFIDDEMVKEDGFVALNSANICVSSGLDSYHTPSPLGRLSYAKPNELPTIIDALRQ